MAWASGWQRGALRTVRVGAVFWLSSACGRADSTTLQPAEPVESVAMAEIQPPQVADSGTDALALIDAAVPCLPGQLSCVEEALMLCDDEGSWTVTERCATEILCRDTVDLCEVSPESCSEQPVECLPPVCEKLEIGCSGRVSQVCNEGRTGFDVLRDCGEPCSGSVCEAGIGCHRQFCAPEEYRCLGGEEDPPTFCNDTCTAFDKEVESNPEVFGSFCNGHNTPQ